MKILQEYIENKILPLEEEYEFDYTNFSDDKKLYKYQVDALKNTLRYIFSYCDDKDKLQNDLLEYLKPKKKENIKINQISYWMATGSGKTIVIIKLIELLNDLYKNNVLPKNDILFLTERDDLIEQFKKSIKEFNTYGKYKILLKSLKEHPAYLVYKNNDTLKFDDNIITVYYYKSGNLRNNDKVSKNNNGLIISYEKLLNNDFNIILDEAHKGSSETDTEDTRRMDIFSKLSKNGFLFNFSATLVNPFQQMMSILKLNLIDYIKMGYGKKISIMSSAIQSFNNDSGYNLEIAKIKEILKAFILLTYIKKCKSKIDNLKYHDPMMVILTNSVNTNDADLKKVFESIFKSVSAELFNEVLYELEKDLQKNVLSNIGKGDEKEDKFLYDYKLLTEIKKEDVFKYVFNKEEDSVDFEYKTLSSNKEISLKYKNSNKDFALIKIGDAKYFSNDFIKNEYGISSINSFDKDGIFEDIDNSTINILMGSRAFYEGWDSLRPNIILYINIGSASAKKFIMQSIGRGIRISPDGKNRKRLENISSIKIQPNYYTDALERLFIFATYPKDISNIIETFKECDSYQKVKLDGIEKISINQKLIKPIYDDFGYYYENPDQMDELKLLLNNRNFEEFKKYIDNKSLSELLVENIENQNINIERLLFIKNNFTDFIEKHSNYKEVIDKNKIFDKIMNFIMQEIKKPVTFDEIDGKEIKNYGKITIDKDILEDVKNEINKVKNSNGNSKICHRITIEDFISHYYCPVLYTDIYNEKITNIIYNESEFDFLKTIKELKINEKPNLIFSRIKEKIDDIFLPYIDKNSKIQKFYPDFVFWYENDKEYRIIFIDPKGIENSDYLYKIDGFEKYLKSNKISNILEKDVRVILCIYHYKNNITNSIEKYKNYIVNKDNLLNIFKDDYDGGIIFKK